GFDDVPRTLGIIQPILLFLVVAASRVLGERIFNHRRTGAEANRGRSPVLIYGAGVTGRQLAQALATSHEMKVVGFVDDDRSLHNSRIGSLRVYDPAFLRPCVERLGVREVLLAIPSTSRSRRREIIESLKLLGLEVRTLPGLTDLAHGTVEASDLRKVTIEDLLQRDIVPYERHALREHVTDRVILVTGA